MALLLLSDLTTILGGPVFGEKVNYTGKSSLLEWKNYKFGTGMKEKVFDKNAFKRAR